MRSLVNIRQIVGCWSKSVVLCIGSRTVFQPARVLMVTLFVAANAAQANGFQDPLDTPAQRYQSHLTSLPVQSMASLEGDRLVAIGLRGVVLHSRDAGLNWVQALVPVSSDLLDVSFASPEKGWVVGQDAVVLVTEDAGLSWTKQFSGREVETLIRYYRDQHELAQDERDILIDQIDMNLGGGPVLPFLTVHFLDENRGMAGGSFGMLIETRDGGRNWQPAMHKLDNPDFLHLNDIADVGGNLFIASEQGVVFRNNGRGSVFEQIHTGHIGTFFSIAGKDDIVLAGGLGGVIYFSRDLGESWSQLNSPLQELVSRINFDEQTQRFIALTIGGEVLSLAADLTQTELMTPRTPMRYTDFAIASGRMIFSGIEGLRQEEVAGMITGHGGL